MRGLITFIAKDLVFAIPLVWLLVVARLPKRQRLEFVLFSAASVVVATVLVKLAAHLHDDPRPFVRDGVHPYFAHGNDNGFPSDHTVFSALIACVVLRYHRPLGLGLLLAAALIGTCRVAAGVHHAQDIIGGFVIAAMGVAIAWLLGIGLVRFKRRGTSVASDGT